MKKLLTSTALIAAMAMPAFAQDTLDPNAQSGGGIVVTYKDDVATLDPAIGYDWQNWSMIKSLFDGLMDYEPGTTNLMKDLAKATRGVPEWASEVETLEATFKTPEAKKELALVARNVTEVTIADGTRPCSMIVTMTASTIADWAGEGERPVACR